MRKFVLAGTAALGLLLLLPANTRADSASDALGECLTGYSTGNDRLAFVEWMFTALASHPAVAQYSNIPPDQKAAITKKVSTVIIRLMTVDCRAQTLAALRSGDASALRAAFSTFGRVATTDLMSNPAVQNDLAQLGKNFNSTAMQDLMKEAKPQP